MFFTCQSFVPQLKGLQFADAMDAVKDKGVLVLMASAAAVDTAEKEQKERHLNLLAMEAVSGY